MAFQIEHGIALPPAKSDIYNSRYPFPKMAVGDSIFVLGARAGRLARAAAYAWAKANGKKMRSTSVDGGIRIWRVA